MENVGRTIATSCFIELSSNLQITRTSIKSRTILILVQFHILASKLPALKGLKDLRKYCPEDSNFIFDQLRLAGNGESYKSSILGQIG